MTTPKPGDTFTHRHYLTADRQPARMRVTAVRHGSVYYTYADSPTNKGLWYLPLDKWVTLYDR